MGNIVHATIEERFIHKFTVLANRCWQWHGTLMPNGYGIFFVSKSPPKCLAHIYSYERINGPVPDGLVIDHLCRNRACVNPLHLEAVTMYENSMRGEHPKYVARRTGFCKRGHPRTPANLYFRRTRAGCGVCKQCCAEYKRERRERLREERNAL